MSKAFESEYLAKYYINDDAESYLADEYCQLNELIMDFKELVEHSKSKKFTLEISIMEEKK